MNRAAIWIGLVLLTMSSGCFYIPVWRVPTHPACQCAEDSWGDAVDWVGNQSPIARPWHDPHYCPQGVYRVAPPGTFIPASHMDDNAVDPNAPKTPEAPPPAEDTGDDLGDLKPPMLGPGF